MNGFVSLMAVLTFGAAAAQPNPKVYPSIHRRLVLPGAASGITEARLVNRSVGFVWSSLDLWRTSDGGRRWQLVVLPSVAVRGGITDCRFLTPSFGWILMGDGVHFSSDGGASWWGRQPKGFVAEDVSCVGDRLPCWVSGGEVLAPNPSARTKPVIFRTEDGAEWNRQTLPASDAQEIRSLHFASDSNGLAVGDHALFYTRDGGATWARAKLKTECVGPALSTEGAYVTFGAAYLGESAWVALDHNLLRTDDGGRTFCERGYPPNATLRQVFFTSLTAGWGVDHWGRLYHTRDGGDSWQIADLRLHIVDLDVLSPTLAWVVAPGNLYEMALGN